MISTQLHTALVEADPARDREFRERAEAFYDKLIAWLKTQADMKKYRLMKYESMVAPEALGNVYSYEVKSKVLGFEQEYPAFSIILAPFRTGTARFGRRGKEKAIVLPVLTGDALKTEDGHEMAINVGWVREVFIHEFIHYLDDLRYKGKPTVVSAALEKKGGKAAYFNSPVEFNAYFQGGASEIEVYASKMGPGQFAKKFGRPGTGYKKFRKEFERLFNKSWRNELDDKWKRKYEVRLWQLYQNMLARARGTE